MVSEFSFNESTIGVCATLHAGTYAENILSIKQKPNAMRNITGLTIEAFIVAVAPHTVCNNQSLINHKNR